MSFWRAFGFQNTTAVDTILDKESFTLEELLDEEDILQEVKGQNKKLLDFLILPETLEKLFDFVTKPPAEDVEDEKYIFKYPFVACEILCSEVWTVCEAIYENNKLLDELYSFLSRDPPLNSILASYVSRVAIVLLQRKTASTLEYIKQKENIVGNFIKHIGSSAVMDLLLKIIACEEVKDGEGTLEWLRDENLIPRLVSKFESGLDEEVHDNATQALVDIVNVSTACKAPNLDIPEVMAQANIPRGPSPLLEQLKSEEIVTSLFTYMFKEDSLSTFTQCLIVLIQLLQSESSSEYDDTTSLEQLPPFLKITTENISRFNSILSKPTDNETMECTFGAIKPLGFPRLKIIEFILSLICTNHRCIHTVIAEQNIISTCLDLFFMYPWNNFLHFLVQQLTQTILEGQNVDLQLSLFTQSKLLDRIVQCSKDNEAAMAKERGIRLGLMGFVTFITINTLSVAANLPELQTMLDEHEGWNEYIQGPYAETRDTETQQLGGHKPLTHVDNSSDDDELDFDTKENSEIVSVFTQYLAQQGFQEDFPEEFNDNEEDYEDDGEIVFDPDGTFDSAFSPDEKNLGVDYDDDCDSDDVDSESDGDSEDDLDDEVVVEEAEQPGSPMEVRETANESSLAEEEQVVESKSVQEDAPTADTSTANEVDDTENADESEEDVDSEENKAEEESGNVVEGDEVEECTSEDKE